MLTEVPEEFAHLLEPTTPSPEMVAELHELQAESRRLQLEQTINVYENRTQFHHP